MKTALIIQKSKTSFRLYELKQFNSGEQYIDPIGFSFSNYHELAPFTVKPNTNEYREANHRDRWDEVPKKISLALKEAGFEKIIYISADNYSAPFETNTAFL